MNPTLWYVNVNCNFENSYLVLQIACITENKLILPYMEFILDRILDERYTVQNVLSCTFVKELKSNYRTKSVTINSSIQYMADLVKNEFYTYSSGFCNKI